MIKLLNFFGRVFIEVGKFNRDVFKDFEKFFIRQQNTEIDSEFVFFLIVRVIADESHFVIEVGVILFKLVPVVVFGLVIVAVLPLHALLEDINKLVEDYHELLGLWLS